AVADVQLLDAGQARDVADVLVIQPVPHVHVQPELLGDVGRLAQRLQLALPVGGSAGLGVARGLNLDGLGAEHVGHFDLPGVAVVDVPAILAQVYGDAVGPTQEREHGGRDGIGLGSTAGLPHRGDVVDVDAQASHGDLTAGWHAIPCTGASRSTARETARRPG